MRLTAAFKWYNNIWEKSRKWAQKRTYNNVCFRVQTGKWYHESSLFFLLPVRSLVGNRLRNDFFSIMCILVRCVLCFVCIWRIVNISVDMKEAAKRIPCMPLYICRAVSCRVKTSLKLTCAIQSGWSAFFSLFSWMLFASFFFIRSSLLIFDFKEEEIDALAPLHVIGFLVLVYFVRSLIYVIFRSVYAVIYLYTYFFSLFLSLCVASYSQVGASVNLFTTHVHCVTEQQ